MKVKFFFVFLLVGCSVVAQQPRSFTDNSSYTKLCHELIQDARFEHFKRDPLFTLFAENVSQQEGAEELQAIKTRFPAMLKDLRLCARNDRIGDPRRFVYGDYGSFSPATLRYARIAAELKQKFGALDNLRLLEIGGGYGGLCTVLSNLFALKSYTIVDLPESLELCAHYLRAQKIEGVSLVALPNVPKSDFDLVVSYLFFSECDRTIQNAYIDQILSHASAGFLICAPARWIEIPLNAYEHKRVKPLPEEKIVRALAARGVKAEVCAEDPSTGRGHCVIFWKK